MATSGATLSDNRLRWPGRHCITVNQIGKAGGKRPILDYEKQTAATVLTKFEFRATDSGIQRNAFAEVGLDLDLSNALKLIDAACYAGFVAYANLNADANNAFAVNCVELTTDTIWYEYKVRTIPILRAALSVSGDPGNTRIAPAKA